MSYYLLVAILGLLLLLGLLAFFVSRRSSSPEAPPELKTEGTRIAEVFNVAAKREEIRLEEINAKVTEAISAAEGGKPEPARAELSAGWNAARGEGGKDAK